MKKFDLIVVGAGPAGLMAAITAAENGGKVALIDKNKKVGKKLLMTGGGRCNVTNTAPVDEIIANIPGNGRFLHSAFAQFDNGDIRQFFEGEGVALKEEDHGRLFPTTDKSATIVAGLYNRLLSLHVSHFAGQAVGELKIKDGQVTGVDDFEAPAVILATGGKSYPSTGSTGDGYRLAKSAGHTITPLFATESALKSSEKFILDKTLQGISLREIELSVLDEKGKTVVKHHHDLLFTHFGLSGPAALRCSSFINQMTKPVTVSLDLFPDKSRAEIQAEIDERLSSSNKSPKNALAGLTQERLISFFLEQEGDLASNLKAFTIKIDGTFPIEKSFVTGGGVNLKEINPKTLESKLTQGLYFAGELLDINGYTGGYNITAAFVTGHVAGLHAAQG